MKTTYNWLKEYVDIKIEPRKLADLLTMSGSTVSAITRAGSDTVFEFEIMSNRPDCLSTVGIAREVAALTDKKVRFAALKASVPKRGTEKIAVKILDKNLCLRYTGKVIRDVQVGSSPEWLKSRLLAIDLRPVNNIVDITNFCLFELGQPLHAFDLDKINGDIYVRQAKEGEKITAIDGIERRLEKGMLVIADESAPIAIAGVMGGLYTEVTRNSKNIFLESAYFNPVSVRRTSRKLGLSSPSSYRFERGVDKGMVLPASDRASSLISDLAKGKIGKLIDVGEKKISASKINFDIEKSNAVLGVQIKKETTKKIFRGLGLGVKDKTRTLEVTVPSFRNDIIREIDLTEELARIYGYDRIPLTIPHIIGNIETKDGMQILKDKIREALSGSGLDEILTYNLVSRKSIQGLGISEENVISIKNPLSIEQTVMAPSLLPGMLGAISYNINRKIKNLIFFEIGKIYKKEDNAYEEDVFSIGITGNVFDNWNLGGKKSDFFYLKGVLWNLFEELGLDNLNLVPGPIPGFSKSSSSVIIIEHREVGFIGEVTPEEANKFDIKEDVYFAQISLEKILGLVRFKRKFKPISKYPSVERDISIVADKEVVSGSIVNFIESRGEGLIKRVWVFDVYEGDQIPKDKKGLSIRIEYRDDTKTLTDDAVAKLHEEVKKVLSDTLHVSFR